MRLIVEHVSHGYGSLEVLDDISLTVEEGEILAVIGPSGCGKSTLLGILGGLLEASRGRILTDGAVPSGSLNPITYIFQDFALLPWHSVAANVGFALEHHRLDAYERKGRVDEVLAMTGLLDFATALPKQLSGGMRQRVGIARALAVKPAILLLDEPLSALDAQTRELLIEEFLALWLAHRTTAVYVTHNLDEALRLADRICVLSRRPGRIREIVAVDAARSERGMAALAPLRERLWRLIQEEARAADREHV
ncbi:MAG: ABC transporter ATP-binding protein [Alphaproteobacteria bacterium]|nr:ABC transporter ATP-binding protein [Alphaproteobacteria bacterium]